MFVSQTGFIYWFIYHHGMFVSQTGFIYWFTHQSSWCLCITDWVYLLIYSSIIMACLYLRLGLFTGLPIYHHGMFVSQTGFIYWFTHHSSWWRVWIPDWVYLLVYPSIMACLDPRLGLFTGLPINHHGVFVSQTGFICWFTHQSSWRVCMIDG